ncbi:CRE-KLP-19 protein [Caenorhabditis remanei]|uniref:CRE-KLP-19 protein n=1 Tax=Caenorhabditis remanei TaxID=31234 RepID=E3M6Q3_CAERE|nr:CRE-KLP-19 protein [Caenorhabditis remanei]
MSASETSLRVVVRARPMNARENKEGARRCVDFFETTGQRPFTKKLLFPFSIAYLQVIFGLQTSHLNAFSGFNATILAYGQTGSGKTYTMGTEDNDGTDEMRRGIIPRLVHALFQRIMATEAPEAFTVTVSMFEVYGDNVYDLLRADKVKLNVHGDEKNCTIVNLTAVPVIDLKGALKQLATGCHYRTKAETAMNAMSSRSHAVFTVFVEKTATSDSDSAFSAKLQLVDLAGSERLKKTEAEGNRMREGININAGLLILSQVIAALATKQKHIPYRNSVITRVLQDSLGGNSYTVFLACISPADSNSQETLNTLRYADRAKQIKNKPIVNKNPKAEEIAVLHAQIKRLQQEVSDLKQGIAPPDVKCSDVANSVEIVSLKDEISRKTQELRERTIKQSECIIRINHLAQKNARLEAEKMKLSTVITDVRNTLQNEEMIDSDELVRSVQQLIDSEELTALPEEDQDETTTGLPSSDDTVYDAERLPELQAELDDLENQIALKDENRQKALDEQREFIEAMKQRESEKTQLVVRVGELETEINKLRQETKKASTVTKIAEERRQRLKELERQHAEDKKTLSELKKLQETRRRMEETLKKTEEELKNLRTQRLRLLREQRAEASKFQAFKQKHEREMAQMKSKLQKREMDVVRQKRVDDQKLAVLQQRLAESNRTNKTLRELNLKRANRKGSTTDASAIQSLIEDELELEITSQRCHLLCEELRRQRQDVMQRINEIESRKFEGAKKRRMSNVDPDVSIVLPGEEEFEENRQKELTSLRASLDTINEEIKDSLRNETISGNEERSTSRWEKVPVEMRPILEVIYSHAVAYMRKELELEFKLTKTKNEYSAKLAIKASQEEKRKREGEEMKSEIRDLKSNVEAAKADLHERIKFLLGLVMSGQVDEELMQHFESLKNHYCDVDQKVKKLARRRTTHHQGSLLTPKPELKRNERARRAVDHYGKVVNSEDVTMDDSRHFHTKKIPTVVANELNRTTDENVRRKVAMSPIKFDDDTRLPGVYEDMENVEEGSSNNETFVKKSENDSIILIDDGTPSTSSDKTFVISTAADDGASEDIPPIRRKHRRTGLGPSLS